MNVDGEYVPPFCIRDGKIFIRRKRGIMELLGDFTLTLLGKHNQTALAARVHGVIAERLANFVF